MRMARDLGRPRGRERLRQRPLGEYGFPGMVSRAPRSAGTDSWDAYPAARGRRFESLATKANPVGIGGDIHAFNVNQLKLDFDNPASPVVASEFVGSSVTSQGWSQDRVDALRPDNPHVLYADSRYRGYVRVEVTPKRLSAE